MEKRRKNHEESIQKLMESIDKDVSNIIFSNNILKLNELKESLIEKQRRMEYDDEELKDKLYEIELKIEKQKSARSKKVWVSLNLLLDNSILYPIFPISYSRLIDYDIRNMY